MTTESSQILAQVIENVSASAKRGVEYRFTPIWDAKREVVTMYRLAPRQQLDDVEEAGTGPSIRYGIDAFTRVLRQATATLKESLEAEERFLLALPMKFEALAAAVGRTEMTSALRNVPDEIRAYLVVHVVDVPPGIPQSRMSEVLSAVKPFCKAVFANAPLGMQSFAHYQNSGLNALGLVVSEQIPVGAMQDEILKLCQASKRLGVLALLMEVSSRELAGFARENGINLLSGPLFGERERPQAMSRLKWDELRRTDA
jgi:hypothetical protein